MAEREQVGEKSHEHTIGRQTVRKVLETGR